MRKKKNRVLRIILTILGILGVTVIALMCVYRMWARPPKVGNAVLTVPPSPIAPSISGQGGDNPVTGENGNQDQDNDPGEEQSTTINTTRKEGVYTILLVGNDDGQGNTDTILVGKIDTKQHQMDFITIPRDTLINMPWIVRKINCVYWGSRYSGGDGISALKTQISRLTGFEPDCYVVVDLNVFMDAVDLIGGVYFDVPMDMDYVDASQNLTIHLKKGYQLLDGYQAMGCVRFRKGYANADLGRIETQHKFLSACASQFLSAGSIPHMPELLKLLADNLDTDLSAANMAYFAEEFLKCKPEDIRFHTPDLGGGLFNGYSYVTLALDSWLDMVNELINPFTTPVTRQNVDIVYITAWGIEGTQGVRGADYYVKQNKADDTEKAEDAQPAQEESTEPAAESTEPAAESTEPAAESGETTAPDSGSEAAAPAEGDSTPADSAAEP